MHHTIIGHASSLAKLHDASTYFSHCTPSQLYKLCLKKTHKHYIHHQTLPPQTLHPPLTFNLFFSKFTCTYTTAKMTYHFAKNLCIFCDKVFTPCYQMKHKRSHLVVMELDDDDDDDSVIDDTQFPLPHIQMIQQPSITLSFGFKHGSEFLFTTPCVPLGYIIKRCFRFYLMVEILMNS